ncbi:MAG: carboxypeptidase-like regulatory domain-containing protein, partial [Flavobacteriales bacterium]|nr:carboxypeptidase-like regulatory domain-containing protein [Flavobacteriales bacterium]
MKYLLRSLLSVTFLCFFAIAMGQYSVEGTVTDDTGFPLPGVSVRTEDSSIGTSTNLDGYYKIDLPGTRNDSLQLVYSFIGYKLERRKVGQQTTINVSLVEDTEVLEEAVVAAIGIKKEKRKVGYAVTEVGKDEIEKSGELNVMNALNAKVAGVNVTS